MYHFLFYSLISLVLILNHLSQAASADDERAVASSSIGTAGGAIGAAAAADVAGSNPSSIVFKDFRTPRPFPTFSRVTFPSRVTAEGIYTEPNQPIVLLVEGASAEGVNVPTEPSSTETVLKRIIKGKDGRKPIINSASQWPYRVIAQISSDYDGREFGGTGTLVGPRHILTVGHNVFSNLLKKWATKVLVRFSLEGAYLPFDQQQVLRAYTYKNWVESLDPEYDIALFVLDHPIGREIGWHGLASIKPSLFTSREIHIAGYPMEVKEEDVDEAYKVYVSTNVGKFRQMWAMSSGEHAVMVSKNRLYYEVDTSSGQSGSGVWYQPSEHLPYIIGVHAYGETEHGKGNYGARITSEKMRDLLEWISSTHDVKELPSVAIAPAAGVGGSAAATSSGSGGAAAGGSDTSGSTGIKKN